MRCIDMMTNEEIIKEYLTCTFDETEIIDMLWDRLTEKDKNELLIQCNEEWYQEQKENMRA
jgi:hypothetical protein